MSIDLSKHTPVMRQYLMQTYNNMIICEYLFP